MKKVLSLVLVIAMVLSSMSFAFGATFNDVADDNDYAEAVETLKALGVIDGYEDGSFKPEKTVTRAEMAKLMVVLLGYGDLVTGSKSNFSDTQGHWADSYIGLAAGRGIVVGTGDGKFNPERTVSYDEVLTMLVRGLGYTDSSNELKNMTWPTNFKVKAAELNITKNVAINSTGADRGGVAQAMFNSLDQQLVKVNSDGDIVKEYVAEGKDEIPVRLISRIAIPDYTFEVKFENIDPDSKNYAGDKVDLTQYLFQTVEAYFSKNNSKEVVYVGDVDSLTYTDDFDKFDGGKLVVGDYTFDISGALVSYNNDEVSLSDFKAADLEDAKITVVLAAAETRVKDDADAVGLIVEKASAYVQIEEEYKDGATEIDEIYLPVKDKKVDSKNLIIKGDVTELEDIEKEDIVAAFAPLDDDPTVEKTDKLMLVVTRNTIEGKVTGTASDAYYVDRTKYDVNDALDMGVLEIGDEGTFYLDQNGDIIAFKGESEGTKVYAVVDEMISGRYEVNNEKATVIRAPKVKLHTSSNETITYSFDFDIEWKDGKWIVDNEDIKGLFTLGLDSDKTTAGDRVISIANDLSDELVEYSLNSKSDEVTSIEEAGRAIIDMKTDSKSFVLASNAVIFDADGNVISESKLGSSVDGKAVFKNGKIVALYATNTADEETYYYAYVNSVYQDTDEDDNEIQRVNAYIQGVKNEKLLTSDDDTFNFKGTSGKGLYILGLNDDDVVQSNKEKLSIKANVTTASAVNTSTGKITLADDSEVYFDQNAGTIIRIKTNGDIEIVSKLSAIKADTKVECFKAVTGYNNTTAVYSDDTINFIIIWE